MAGGHRLSVTRAVAALTILLAIGFLGAGSARGERSQKGDVRVTFNADVFPRSLPRDHPVPIGLRIDGRIHALGDSPLPQVKEIRLQLAGRGVISVDGLGSCSLSRLRFASSRLALRRCGSALVGDGEMNAAIYPSRQPPLPFHAHLLAFNGRTALGAPAIWVHVFSPDPPLSFVIPFAIAREPRRARTTIVARIPRSLGRLPHLESFDLRIFRRFRYRREWRSYLEASCPVPARLPAGFLTTRGTYAFSGGMAIGLESTRSCRAR